MERLTAWLVRQTGVRLDTLKRHYEKQWPRDRAAIHRTYALLDPGLDGADTGGSRRGRLGGGRAEGPAAGCGEIGATLPAKYCCSLIEIGSRSGTAFRRAAS